jgi:adenine phosphoribosyltransferase
MNPRERLTQKIRAVHDFPRSGIIFRDITPLLQDKEALRIACDLLAAPFRNRGIELVVGIESRGFIFGAPVALALDAGFTMTRKVGKLPGDTVTETYELEYGLERVEMQRDAVQPRQRVLLVDDVLATGGTAAATVELVRRLGGEVVGSSFLLELSDLKGRKRLSGIDVHAVLKF